MTTPEHLYGFPCIPADYVTHPLQRYANNPLINALRFPASRTELMGRLTNLPPFEPSMRQADGMTRKLLLMSLKRLTIGLPRLAALAQEFHAAMVEGYVGREPHTAAANRRLQEYYREYQSTKKLPKPVNRNTAQFASALMGMSGCGKSFGLEAVAGLYPPVIHHEELGVWQIPVVRLEMPYKGVSLLTLGTSLVQELDRLFPQGEYAQIYLKGNLNAEQLLLRAMALLHTHCVGHALVDEAQNQDYEDEELRVAKPMKHKKNQTPLTTMLITMSNRSQIPFLMSGTSELKQVLSKRLSFLRRTIGPPWGPLETTAKSGRPSEFDMFLSILWSYQFLRKPVPLTPRMRELMLLYTFAIPDLMVKLFMRLQTRALNDYVEELSEELIHRVAAHEMTDVVDVVVAMKEADKAGARSFLRDVSDVAAEFNIRPDTAEFARNRLEQPWSPRTALEAILRGSPSEAPQVSSADLIANDGAASCPASVGDDDGWAGEVPVRSSDPTASPKGPSDEPTDDGAASWSPPTASRPKRRKELDPRFAPPAESTWKDLGK